MTNIETISSVIIIPVVLGVLRVLFASELQYFISLVISYIWRPFDIDRNGKTHDWCMLHSSASGSWSYVSLLYKFNPFNGTSGVHVHRYDENWNCISVERVRFADWAHMRKAVILFIPVELRYRINKPTPPVKNVEYDC